MEEVCTLFRTHGDKRSWTEAGNTGRAEMGAYRSCRDLPLELLSGSHWPWNRWTHLAGPLLLVSFKFFHPFIWHDFRASFSFVTSPSFPLHPPHLFCLTIEKACFQYGIMTMHSEVWQSLPFIWTWLLIHSLIMSNVLAFSTAASCFGLILS